MKKLLLGNAAVARGAFEAGVKVATAYPGTPSTEITENIAKFDNIYCEWSPNEKVALEVAIGASIGGARSICCMKHVGLNVAADPLFTVSYTGINGGLVIVVADDPGMHSSQNEQDSRFYAMSAHIPMLEPSDSNEAKEFTKLAFELSEKYDTPIILRLTTRVAHSQSFVELNDEIQRPLKPYQKNIAKYVMVPANAKFRHIEVEKRMNQICEDVNSLKINYAVYKDNKIGVVCSGAVYQYVLDAMPDVSIYKAGTVFPLPVDSIKEFSNKVEKLIVIEELEPFIENQLKVNGIGCSGKEISGVQGELSVDAILQKFNNTPFKAADANLPGRPPVMCAGCPHRGIFYILNKLKTVVCGDIGCYSLGAAPPLNAMDAVVCMGASVGMAHGMEKAVGRDFSKKTVAVIGDSTFVHSGITGLIEAVYNQSNITLIILDNFTTGTTGHHDHPATGKTIKNEQTYRLNLKEVCLACGANSVSEVDAYDLNQCEQEIKKQLNSDGVSVIIVKRPCVLLEKSKFDIYSVDDKCTNCKMCLKLGCPAICKKGNKVEIDANLCTGCGVCANVCKFSAINKCGGAK